MPASFLNKSSNFSCGDGRILGPDIESVIANFINRKKKNLVCPSAGLVQTRQTDPVVRDDFIEICFDIRQSNHFAIVAIL